MIDTLDINGGEFTILDHVRTELRDALISHMRDKSDTIENRTSVSQQLTKWLVDIVASIHTPIHTSQSRVAHTASTSSSKAKSIAATTQSIVCTVVLRKKPIKFLFSRSRRRCFFY